MAGNWKRGHFVLVYVRRMAYCRLAVRHVGAVLEGADWVAAVQFSVDFPETEFRVDFELVLARGLQEETCQKKGDSYIVSRETLRFLAEESIIMMIVE